MTTITETRPWDLTALLDFLPAVSVTKEHVIAPERPREQDEDDCTPRVSAADLNEDRFAANTVPSSSATGLGNFSKVWQFLGTPGPALDDPTSRLEPIPSKDDYASDGATYKFSRPRQPSIQELSDETGGEDAVTFPSSSVVLEKCQPSIRVETDQEKKERNQEKNARKKARKKARKALQTILDGNRTTLSESECDSTFGKETPARKASSHVMSTRSMITRSMAAKMNVHTHLQLDEEAANPVAGRAAPLLDNELLDTPCPTSAPRARSLSRGATSPTRAARVTIQKNDIKLGHTGAQRELTLANSQLTTPNVYKKNNLIPSSIPPSQNSNIPTVPRQVAVSRSAQKAVSTPIIEPRILRSGVARNHALLLKIIDGFGQDLHHLVNPMNLTTHNNDPTGIHVFIDASNIFIGFVDQLKRSRNIHPMQQVPEANLSFDSLALLIERRRPVAKRVLVGSTPHVPAFDKAKAVGYETNILEKVLKARELTPRQIYFKEVEVGRRRRKSTTQPPPPHKIALAGSVLTPRGEYGSGSGSETTTTPMFTRAKMVEQGVDEILHMKMLESVVDADVPSTMVLATGDAACAEYSSGFISNVERALRKGWTVELVSWSKNISSMYRRREWIEAWGPRFRIVELDDYAEELLDM